MQTTTGRKIPRARAEVEVVLKEMDKVKTKIDAFQPQQGRRHRPSARTMPKIPRQMDREKLRQYLNQTENHIATTNQLVTDQRALIARFEELGYDTAPSKTILAHLEQLRELHIADRDRLSRMLSELGE